MAPADTQIYLQFAIAGSFEGRCPRWRMLQGAAFLSAHPGLAGPSRVSCGATRKSISAAVSRCDGGLVIGRGLDTRDGSRNPKLATRSFRIQGGDDQKGDMALGRAPRRQKNQIDCSDSIESKGDSIRKTTRRLVARRADKKPNRVLRSFRFQGGEHQKDDTGARCAPRRQKAKLSAAIL